MLIAMHTTRLIFSLHNCVGSSQFVRCVIPILLCLNFVCVQNENVIQPLQRIQRSNDNAIFICNERTGVLNSNSGGWQLNLSHIDFSNSIAIDKKSHEFIRLPFLRTKKTLLSTKFYLNRRWNEFVSTLSMPFMP